MNKKLFLILTIFFGVVTIVFLGFAKYYANSFSRIAINDCDKYLSLSKNTSDMATKYNALTEYNTCTSNIVVANVINGVSKSQKFLYTSIASFIPFLISLILLTSKVTKPKE